MIELIMYYIRGDNMEKLSKVDAAFIILQESKREMSYKEIIKIALERDLIETKGKTPEQTLRVDIKKEIERRKKSNKPQRFVMKEGGIVSLH